MSADSYAARLDRLAAVLEWLETQAQRLHADAMRAQAEGDRREIERLDADWRTAEGLLEQCRRERRALREQAIAATRQRFEAWRQGEGEP